MHSSLLVTAGHVESVGRWKLHSYMSDHRGFLKVRKNNHLEGLPNSAFTPELLLYPTSEIIKAHASILKTLALPLLPSAIPTLNSP